MNIDATNMILGRLASKVAKAALNGEDIVIVNCENAVISGSRKNVFERYKIGRLRGTPFTGPFTPRSAERIVKRTIRGMLPHKQDRGRDAMKKIICYRGIPDSLKNEKFEKIKEADMETRLNSPKYVTVKELSLYLGARI
jgi:large subunit ribosomal protein L13